MQTVSAKTSAMSTLLLGCSDSGIHLTGFAGSRCELRTPLQPLGHGHFALIRVRMGTVTGRTRASCTGGNRFAEGASSELRPRQPPTKYEVQSAKTFWSLWPGKRRGAASHGGEANRPITNQGKANGAGMQEKNHPALTTTVQVVPADKTIPSGT